MAEAKKKTRKVKEAPKKKPVVRKKKAMPAGRQEKVEELRPVIAEMPVVEAPVKEVKKEVKEKEVKEVVKPVFIPTRPPKPKIAGPKFRGTGRRKEAAAKVWLAPGSGKITVNGKAMSQYFCGRKLLEFYVTRPLIVTETAGKYDIFAEAFGGGIPGQAGAVGLGIARALVQMNPELKPALKRQGLMTRDPRMKERKKYGLKRARRAFQYTKR